MMNMYNAEVFAAQRHNDDLRAAAQARRLRDAFAADAGQQGNRHIFARAYQRLRKAVRRTRGATPSVPVMKAQS